MTSSIRQKRVGRDLTNGPIFESLMLFVTPIIMSNLIQQLYSMADLMVVGHFVGNTGTIGISTGGEVIDFLTPIAASFATAGQIYIAQLSGAKNTEKLKKAIGSFLSLMLLMSIIFTVFSIIFRHKLLDGLNCPNEAYLQAESYLVITSVGLPAIFGYNAVCGVLRGMGESKKPLLFITIAAIVNVFLDLFLVVIIPLESAGAAIATVMSQLSSFIAAFIYMFKNKEQFDFEFSLNYFKFEKDCVRIIFKLGIPQAMRMFFVRISTVWINSHVNDYGVIESSTNSVGNKLQKFLEVFSISISQASGAMIGQNLGAKKYDRAKKVVYYSVASSAAISAVICIFVLLCPKLLLSIFTKDASVIKMGTDYLRILCIHIIITAFVSCFQSMVIGAGNSNLNFVLGILDGIVCKIGLSMILVNIFDMGVYGYFWGVSLSRILPMCVSMIYFYSNRWQKEKLISK